MEQLPQTISAVSGPYQLAGTIVVAIVIIFYLQYRDSLVKRKVDMETFKRQAERDKEQLRQDQAIAELRADYKRLDDNHKRQWSTIETMQTCLNRMDKRLAIILSRIGGKDEDI